jgi:hypothetical protein
MRKECDDLPIHQCVGGAITWLLNSGQGEATAPPAAKQETAARPEAPSNRVQSSRETAAQLASTQGHILTVVNTGRDVVTRFHASRCHDRQWGANRLASNIGIDPGQKRSFPIYDRTDDSADDGMGGCCFDLLVRFRDGTQRTRMDSDICRAATWSVSDR